MKWRKGEPASWGVGGVSLLLAASEPWEAGSSESLSEPEILERSPRQRGDGERASMKVAARVVLRIQWSPSIADTLGTW